MARSRYMQQLFKLFGPLIAAFALATVGLALTANASPPTDLPDGGVAALPAIDVGDAAAAGSAILDAARVIAGAKDATAKHVGIALLLALVFRSLIQIFKRVLTFAPSAKTWIPWVCMALGVGVVLCSRLAAGSSWIDAAIAGLSGPGAVALQELLALWKKPQPEQLAVP